MDDGARSLQTWEVDAATHGRVDDLRRMRDHFQFSIPETTVIFDEAHRITSEAFSASLKLFEEPPHGAAFLLVTTDPSVIPAPIRDRALGLRFSAVELDVIVKRLLHVADDLGTQLPLDVAGALARAANGSMRSGLKFMEEMDPHRSVDQP